MSSSSCQVRLLNELSLASPVVTISQGEGNVATTSASPSTASPYSPADCSSIFAVSAPGFTPTSFSAPNNSTCFSVLILSSPALSLTAYTLPDECTSLGDAPSTIDSAVLRIINARSLPVSLNGVADECFNCKAPELTSKSSPLITGDAFNIKSVDTSYGYSLVVNDTDSTLSLALPHFAEHSVNTLILHSGGGYSLLVDAAGRNASWPIAWAALILVAIALILKICRSIAFASGARLASRGENSAKLQVTPDSRRPVNLFSFFALDSAASAGAKAWQTKHDDKMNNIDDDDNNNNYGFSDILLSSGSASLQGISGGGESGGASAKSQSRNSSLSSRVYSIDAFRGCALAIMMFVNNGGGNYAFFDHSKWNGLTVADLVFPWFVFLSGVSTALSIDKERKSGKSTASLAWHAVIRAFKLVLLGWLVNSSNYLPHFRVFSVLGYFAFANVTIRLIDLALPSPAPSEKEEEEGGEEGGKQSLMKSLYLDFGQYGGQWFFMACIATLYFCLERLLPVPGCPTGYVGAGGLANNGAYPLCTGGAHYYIDNWLFTANHIYGNATCRDMYHCSPYEPEGALGGLM
jgi:hypothetical protein